MKQILRIISLLVVTCWMTNSLHAASEVMQDTDQKKKKGFFSSLNPFHGRDKEKKDKKPSKKKSSPTPSPTPIATAAPDASIAPDSSPTPAARTTPTPAPNVTISAEEISDYDQYPPAIQNMVAGALGLTTLNLDYRYGSADPVNGGMDCSGFVYYLLTKCGVPDVPRDARDQYAWVRKAGNFQAVLAQNEDTFELNSLQPGDLLFWGSTSSANPDPAISETMVYLGREKGSGKRIMAGASEFRTYKSQMRRGVSVVEFKLSPDRQSDEDEGPKFVGYGHVPGLVRQ